MTAPSSSPRDAIRRIAAHLGIHLEDPRPGDAPTLFRLRTVVERATLDLDEQMLSADRNQRAIADLMIQEVTDAQRQLFRAAIEHIAKHDREPLTRVADLEKRSQALVTALNSGTRIEVDNAMLELERVLRTKPGAASWQRDGYGKDPPR